MSRRRANRPRRPLPGSRRYKTDLELLRDLALLDAGQETGFWDDNGRPAPRPADIDDWRPANYDPIPLEPGEPPF